MISPERLPLIPYFASLNDEQILCLVRASKAVSTQAGEFLFHLGDQLSHFYLVMEGELEIIFESPKLEMALQAYEDSSQIQNEYVILSTIGPDEIVGWSGLIPPHKATSGVRAKSSAILFTFDCKTLLDCFEEDCNFGFHMIHTAAQVIGKRLQDIYKGG